MTRCLVLTGGRASYGPYGIDKMLELGYELVEVAPATGRAHIKIRDVFEHRLGLPLDKTLRSLPKARTADIVLAFLEREALAAAAMKRAKMAPYAGRPLTMLACWLAEELKQAPADERRRIAARYRGVDLTMVWSDNQLDILTDAGFCADDVAAIPFGFAPTLFPETDPSVRDAGLVAIGNDRGRDYSTLIRAVAGTDLTLHLYCKPGILSGLSLPENVIYHGTVPFDEYREVVARAQIVAIPTFELAYPTGQTVALEAAATGACIAISDTLPLSEYFSADNALLVPAGDADAWRRTLIMASRDQQLRERLGAAAAGHVRDGFTYLDMWTAVDRLFRDRGWTSQ